MIVVLTIYDTKKGEGRVYAAEVSGAPIFRFVEKPNGRMAEDRLATDEETSIILITTIDIL